jgi:hypothetical protein
MGMRRRKIDQRAPRLFSHRLGVVFDPLGFRLKEGTGVLE